MATTSERESSGFGMIRWMNSSLMGAAHEDMAMFECESSEEGFYGEVLGDCVFQQGYGKVLSHLMRCVAERSELKGRCQLGFFPGSAEERQQSAASERTGTVSCCASERADSLSRLDLQL
ncbi:hypothetical protein NQZ68_028511 [Dissostichus eleginoides]|nr:hypothetical protein NQZ68_028511 [Dissostichus eleginoides]